MEQTANWKQFANTPNGEPQVRELGWGDEITQDSNNFDPFENGIYMFTVKEYEKTRTRGNEKFPPCNMAKLTLELSDGQRNVRAFDNLVLRNDLEWKIGQFFLSIGMKKENERARIDFDGAIGKSGYVKVEKKAYTNRDGQTRWRNEIARYLAPNDKELLAFVKAAADNTNPPF